MTTPSPSAGSGEQDNSLTLPHAPAVTAESATLPPAAAQSSNDGSAVVANGVRFRRLREHAKGGLGEVFVALDEELNREVALKEIQERFADLDDARTRFLREAEITGKLEHPGVVPVYGLGSYADGRPFYAMRFIHGQSMEEAIARFHKADEDPRRDPGERSLALRELLGRFVAVCNAVAYAHSRGVIHRDLKPANAMLGEYGETLVVDWGLAKVVDEASRGRQSPEEQASCLDMAAPPGTIVPGSPEPTQAGSVLGTPAYMPPEQASGRQDQVGTSSDVFALGATLYCLLTGQPPYSGIDALIQAAMAEYVPARQRKRSVPAALEAVCGKAMAAMPEDRYRSARDLAEEVQRYLADEPVQAYREPLADRARRWGRRNRSVVSAGVMLLAAVVLGLSAGLWAVGREQEKTKAALVRALRAEVEATTSAQLAAEQKDKAQQAEAATLADYRASTDDAIEQLIGSKPVLGAQEKTYLEKTLKRWQVFAARIGEDERSRSIRAEGQFRVAVLRMKLGQSEEAIAGFREALAIQQKLADEFPAVPAHRKDLANIHNDLGLLLANQNQGAKAAEQYDKALTIQQKLADEFPLMREYRTDLARTHMNLGNLLMAQNKREKAAEQYYLALGLQQKLADEFPTMSAYHSALALTHNNLGFLLANQNQGTKATEHYYKALALQQKLADEFPAVPEYREALASTHLNLGNLQNRVAKVAEQYYLALAIQQKLADEFPAVPAYRSGLALTHNNLGILLARQNQGKAAEQFHKALAIRQKLADEFPAVPDYRNDLAATHNNLGLLLAGQNQREKAAEQYRKGLAIKQKLAVEFPAVTAYQVDLGSCCCNYGNLIRDGGKPADSLPWYDKAIRTLTKVHQQEPQVVTPRMSLRNSHWGRAQAYDQLEKHAEAVKDWNRAIELSPRQLQAFLRPQRANSQVRAGQVAEAVAEVAELTKTGRWIDRQWYDFACIYALASGKSADKKEQYADRAMELLHKAVKAGYKDAAHMTKDKDLDVLRERDDFKKLLASLGTAAEAKKTK